MATFADIERDAKALPLHERAMLAERLLETLEDLSPEEHEQIWLDECEKRLEAMKAGKLRTMSSEEFFSRAEQAVNADQG